MEDLKNIKSGKRELREFGVTIGALLILFGDVALWRQKTFAQYALIVGAAMAGLGLRAPAILKPLQKAWMGMGIALGFFVSRIVMAVIFYGIITPTGILMRLLGRDILDQKIEKSRGSYWQIRSSGSRPKESYERQY